MELWMIRLINMSICAGCAALLVLALRLLFRRLPKGYFYVLWLAVLVRFLCPVVIPSPLSLVPVNAEPVGREILYDRTPEIETGIGWVDETVNQVMEERFPAADPANSVNPVQVLFMGLAVVWEIGAVVLGLYFLISYIRLKRRLRTAVRVGGESGENSGRGERIYESDRISGAFVLGIFRPAVYLPAGLDGEERRYILAHERIHVRRFDGLIKLAGLAAVAVHWFNPLSWITFAWLCRDMEMSCDEQTVRSLGGEEKKPYSLALLKAAEQHGGLALPPSFGESHVRSRIANILSYRRRPAAVTALLVCALAVVGTGLLTGRKGEELAAKTISIIGGADGPTSVFLAGKTDGGPANQMPDEEWLSETKIANIFAQEGAGSKVTIDLADENSLVFHGDFGLFSFVREGDQWKLNAYLDQEAGEKMQQAIKQMKQASGLDQADSIRPSDKFQGEEQEGYTPEYDAEKMADGKIAVLGGCADENGSGRLIDLYYGYYDPKEQVLHQVYLFFGDGKMVVNPKGERMNLRKSAF